METVGYTYMAVGGLLSGGQNVQAAEITRRVLTLTLTLTLSLTLSQP